MLKGYSTKNYRTRKPEMEESTTQVKSKRELQKDCHEGLRA